LGDGLLFEDVLYGWEGFCRLGSSALVLGSESDSDSEEDEDGDENDIDHSFSSLMGENETREIELSKTLDTLLDEERGVERCKDGGWTRIRGTSVVPDLPAMTSCVVAVDVTEFPVKNVVEADKDRRGELSCCSTTTPLEPWNGEGSGLMMLLLMASSSSISISLRRRSRLLEPTPSLIEEGDRDKAFSTSR
jgi:hypothetical protein